MRPRGIGGWTLRVFARALTVTLLGTGPSLLGPAIAAAAPNPECAGIDAETVTASAALTMTIGEDGRPEVTTSVRLHVPTTSPEAIQLLLTDEPSGQLVTCLPFPHRYDAPATDINYSAVLKEDGVSTTSSSTWRGDDVRFLWDRIWSISWYTGSPEIRFEGRPDVTWTSVAITADDGIKVQEVTPAPAVYDGKGTIVWRDVSSLTGSESPRVSFSLSSALGELVGDGLVDWGDVIDTVSAATLFTVALYQLRPRRKDQQEGEKAPWPFPEPMRVAGRAVALAGLVIAVTDIRYAFSLYGPIQTAAVGVVVVAVLLRAAPCLGVLAPEGKWRRRSITVLALGLGVFEPSAVGFALCLLAALALVLRRAFRRQSTSTEAEAASPDGWTRRAGSLPWRLHWVVLVAALVGVVSSFGVTGIALWFAVWVLFAGVLGAGLMTMQGTWLTDVLDVRGVVALFLATAVTLGLRWDFPYYLGAGLPLIALLVMSLWLYLLAASRSRCVLAKLTKPESLQEAVAPMELQANLVRAEGVLRTLEDERRALDSSVSKGELTAREKLRKERALQSHLAEIRNLPPILSSETADDDAPLLRRWSAKVQRLSGQPDFWPAAWWWPGDRREPAAPPNPLPTRVNPVDVALALGPRLSAPDNARASVRVVLPLAVLPMGYFIGARVVAYPLEAFRGYGLTVALGELAFWGGFGLCLGLLWSVIPGRRGSTKALLIALPVGVVVVLLWTATTLAHEPVGSAFLLRGLILLVLLLWTGLLMDLQVMRPAEEPTRPALGFFANYYRLNRVIPTVTLLVPLIAAVVGIWGQIDKAPTVVAPPTQGSEQQQRTGSPAASTTPAGP